MTQNVSSVESATSSPDGSSILTTGRHPGNSWTRIRPDSAAFVDTSVRLVDANLGDGVEEVPPSPDIDPFQAVAQLKRVVSSLERDLVGFQPLLIQSIYALLTRENLLIFSPAGTGKTLCAGLIFNRISGARVFDTQMSKGTLADELFGSIDTEQLKTGRIVHHTVGTLVDADFAFIDELFDANDMVLRALLGIFHERVFKKGTQLEKANLHTGIAAANYLRATDVTEAVLDRFLFPRLHCPRLQPLHLARDRSGVRSPPRPGGSSAARGASAAGARFVPGRT